MRTIALRLKEQYAPICGTVAVHQKLTDQFGYVWYGKMGPAISENTAKAIMKNEDPRILLFQDDGQKCYWAHIMSITRQTPPKDQIPVYYRDDADQVGTWYQVSSFEKVEKDVMDRYHVKSSGNTLRNASQQSASQYFVIES